MGVQQRVAPVDNITAEERILAAATEEFAANGFYGARTQAIADAAGVNKAMLHYYYRSKENLYSHVIRAAFKRIFKRVGETWLGPGPLRVRVESVVDTYMSSYEENPALLKIILREVVDGGSRLKRAVAELKRTEFPLDEQKPTHLLQEGAHELGMTPGETVHFVVNLIGMCIVSFISPLILESALDFDVSDMAGFLRDRRKAIKSMVIAYLEGLKSGRKQRSKR